MSKALLSRTSRTSSDVATDTLFLDTNVLLPLAFGDYRSREADFADPDTGALVWIGEDGAIVVDPDQARQLTRVAATAGWHARVGNSPERFGINVRPFRPDFHHPAAGEAKSSLRSAWAIVRDASGVTQD